MFNNSILPRFGAILLIGIINFPAHADTGADNTVSLVEQAARSALARQAGEAGLIEPRFELAAVRSGRPPAPCRQPVSVEPVDTRQMARMRFTAVCGGADGWRYDFVVRASISARVAVAAADMGAGALFSSKDVLLERKDISAIPDSISDLTVFDGMAARRSVRAGELLRQNMLLAPVLVKRGAAVRIVARREQIEVSMAGEALDAGARGALLRVRNANGTVIRARVTGADMVEPADTPASAQSVD
jgi:flagella basal body P-ring formation protein FlgA